MCAWRIQNHQTTCHRVVLSLTLHPLSSPPAVSGAPCLRHPQHPRRRPQRGAAPPRRRGRCAPQDTAVSYLSAGSETSKAGGLRPVALHRTPPLAAGQTAICGVKSVGFILFRIVYRAGSMAATIIAGVCEDHQDYELMEPSKQKIRKREN